MLSKLDSCYPTLQQPSTMSAPKSLPFKAESEYDIVNIIKTSHEIPYHSRPFMWTPDEYVEPTLRDIFISWKMNHVHFLGKVVIYSGDVVPAITDAQHRVTVCALSIIALANLLEKQEPLSWVGKYGGSSILESTIPPEDQEVLEKYGWSRYPNIVSCYEYDFEALGNILNGKTEPSDDAESKIYDAYASIYKIIKDELPDVELRRDFLRYMHNHVKVMRMVTTEWQFTVRLFNTENNIKVPVPPSILLKNVFSSTIGEGHSETIHSSFRVWEKKYYRTFEQFIHTMVNLFTRNLMTFDVYARRIMEIPTLANATGCPFTTFHAVVDRAISAEERLATIPFKRLLDIVNSGYELHSLCLLPIAYMAGVEEHGEVVRLVRALACYAARSNKKFSFNPMACQTFLRGIIPEMLQGRSSVRETVNAILAKLHEWLGEDGRNNSTVAERVATEKYKSAPAFKKARCMLLLMAELTDRHEAHLDYEAIHIDHIYPKTPSASCPELADKDCRHRLGNLTPFVGKNSVNVKGNSSLGNKSFDIKVPEYKKSNIAMTRAVADRYESTGFLDVQIEERSRELAADLATLTARELGL
jgi:hypothetical protein